MPIYTFFPCKPDGSSTSFKALNLESDEAAAQKGIALLQEHRSGAYVTVYLDERQVMRLERPET